VTVYACLVVLEQYMENRLFLSIRLW